MAWATQLVIQPVGEQRVELHAEQPSLCQKGPVLLGVGEEVTGHAAAREHDRLAAECPAFGAADVEGVGEARDVGQGDVGVGSGQAIGEARTVQVQRDLMAAAERREFFQLGQRVQRAQLGGMRNEHHAREHHVGVTGVGVESLQISFHVGGAQFAVAFGHGEHLVPSGFNGTGFMNGDVPRIGSDHALVPGQQSRNDHGVSLGAAREEEHVGGLVIASRADAGRHTFAKAVAAIARRRLQVRRRQRFQNARMGAGGIVVLERDHESSSGLPGDVCRAIIPQRRRWWRKAVREMAIDKVKAYFAEFGREGDVMEFPTSSATVELAAQAVGCEPARIAKTLSFAVGDRVALVVCAGDARIANPKFKAQFGTKPRMLPAEEAEERVGHAVGGVCPFAVNEDCDVYLDESLRRFDVVYPACGSSNSAIALAPDELAACTPGSTWVDVCKLPEEAVA